MVCSMENESIDVPVRDKISGKKSHIIKLSGSVLIYNIFKEISKQYDYKIDDISILLELGPGYETSFVSKIIFNNK